MSAIRACTECARRKNKCDKKSPCGKCLERGVPHLCHAEALQQTQALDADAQTKETLRNEILVELARLRKQTVDNVTRLERLEVLISRGLSTPADSAAHPSRPLNASPIRQSIAPQALNGTRSSSVVLYPSTGEVVADSPLAASSVATNVRVDDTSHLEFLTLNRKQDFSLHENQQRSTRPLPLPTSMYPSLAAIAAVAPSRSRSESLINYALSSLGWLLSVIHVPTFKAELSTFWGKGDSALESTSPSWLALYFALLTVAVSLLTEEQRGMLSLSPEEALALARQWAPCASALLYHSDFLERHTLHGLQMICVLCHSGRDIWSTTVIASLRCTGLSIAMEKNLHRLVSDDAFELSIRDQPTELRAKSLIQRETSKKVFWGLCREDWYACIWRSTFTLRPSQITTPLPLNTNDRDLSAGLTQKYPSSTYTAVAWSNLNVQLGLYVQRSYEAAGDDLAEAHDTLLGIDEELRAWLSQLPQWWQHSAPPVANMSFTYSWLRSAFAIATHHKMLQLHRHYMRMQESRYDVSRRRAVECARAILREARNIGECRIWSVLYHISSATFISIHDLLNQPRDDVVELAAQRAEISDATLVLEAAQNLSGIAQRAYSFVSQLLEMDEQQRTSDSLSTPDGVTWNDLSSTATALGLMESTMSGLQQDHMEGLFDFGPFDSLELQMPFSWSDESGQNLFGGFV